MTTLLLIFFGSFAIGVPIAFVLGLTALYYLLFVGSVPIMILGQRLYAGVDNFVLLAIPFFVFAGELMNRTKITEDLVNFAKMLVGWIPGALAQVNIVTSVFFAGLTGAAVADTAAIGSILIPAMKDEGYTAEYAAAVTVTSSIIGPIIPPSINMVVYSTVTMESVGALFMAGFAPGIAIALGLMIVALFFALRDNHPRRKERLAKGEALRTTRKSLLALLAPVILVGGIFDRKALSLRCGKLRLETCDVGLERGRTAGERQRGAGHRGQPQAAKAAVAKGGIAHRLGSVIRCAVRPHFHTIDYADAT